MTSAKSRVCLVETSTHYDLILCAKSAKATRSETMDRLEKALWPVEKLIPI